MTPDDADAKWKPPAGNWEDAIAAIDTIEKTERGLVCFVQWYVCGVSPESLTPS